MLNPVLVGLVASWTSSQNTLPPEGKRDGNVWLPGMIYWRRKESYSLQRWNYFSYFSVGFILHCAHYCLPYISNIGGLPWELCDDVTTFAQILHVSSSIHRSASDSVKQSAALCLLRLFRTSKDCMTYADWASRVIHLLNDQHMVRCHPVFTLKLIFSYSTTFS